MKDMYEQLCSTAFLFNAWQKVKQKGSAGGIDGDR